MTKTLSIEILGKPQQQGSKTAYVIKGRAVLTEANKDLMPWRKNATPVVQQAMQTQGWISPDKDAAISITAKAFFEKPKTVKREHMTVKPDADHLARAIGDLLVTAGVMPDDSQIVEWHIQKLYGTPKIIVDIHVL